jgi:hypothetical protein
VVVSESTLSLSSALCTPTRSSPDLSYKQYGHVDSRTVRRLPFLICRHPRMWLIMSNLSLGPPASEYAGAPSQIDVADRHE